MIAIQLALCMQLGTLCIQLSHLYSAPKLLKKSSLRVGATIKKFKGEKEKSKKNEKERKRRKKSGKGGKRERKAAEGGNKK